MTPPSQAPPAKPRPTAKPKAGTPGVAAPPAAPAAATAAPSPNHHEGLIGGRGTGVRYRPERVSKREFRERATITFIHGGEALGPCDVLDVSEFGIGFAPPPEHVFREGARLEAIRIWMEGRKLWEGEATVVHQSASGRSRSVGARFTTGLLDAAQLRTGSIHRHDRLASHQLGMFDRQVRFLPAEWRAEVSDYAFLFRRLADHLDGIDRDIRARADHLPPADEQELFEGLWDSWGQRCMERSRALWERSEQLPKEVLSLAKSYAATQVLPVVYRCPMYRQAYDKPLGYAGDYRLMEMFYADAPEGDTLFARFMHYAAQRHPLGQTVRHRERNMRSAIRRAVDEAGGSGHGPVRIMSLACGPAVEVRRFLDDIEALDRPVELLLVDQDREALRQCHREIFRLLIERHRGRLPIEVRCLHISVGQLLNPGDSVEAAAVHDLLGEVDLIYSAGLFDYLTDRIARMLVRRLFDMLRPGGRLLVGNLRESPDNRWVMEYVLDWNLIYRTQEATLSLGQGLKPLGSPLAVELDDTGHCAFLSAQRG